MSFMDMNFLLFVLLAVVGYYLIPKRFQWIWLLAFSYIYYAASGIKILVFLLYTTLTTYGAGMALQHLKGSTLEKSDVKKKKRRMIILTLLLNFGLLAVLKYTNFALTNINNIFGTTLQERNFLLPLGISFYTFQSMGYILDVYWEKAEAETNPFRFALFVSFFPQILQGPIGRFSRLATQLYESHRFDWDRCERALLRIVWGYFKKVVIADNAALFVDAVFDQYQVYPGLAVIGVLAYSAQLYGDFSGGMDIVIGIGSLFGIEMDENFRQPYFAKSITDFWHRWHITLGTWMKDYIFYPVSLSRWMGKFGKWGKKTFGKSIGRTLPICLANVIVFLVVGVWHGAAWTFIMYGLYNGLIIAISGLLDKRFRSWKKACHIAPDSKGFALFQILRTFALVNISWYFDCSDSLGQVWTMFVNSFTKFNLSPLFTDEFLFVGQGTTNYSKLAFIIVLFGCIVLFVVSVLRERKVDVSGVIMHWPVLVKVAFYLLLLFLIPMLGQPPSATGGFIYAQF